MLQLLCRLCENTEKILKNKTMLWSKILVAYDDSDLAQRALEKAMEIGKIKR